MSDELFSDEPELLDAYAQDGPDLFGMQPDELIVTHEPDVLVAQETDIDFDEVDEIPIDPEDIEADEVVPEPVMPSETALEPQAAAPSLAEPVADKASLPQAPLALYRRYRPDVFADLIGQDHVTVPLQRALANNRVNHAYLFSGPRGCGKTTSARILARCLNCVQGPTATPCGVCQSCRDLARGGGGSIDVIEIDAASYGGVNEARDLRERAYFSPAHSQYKIYIIDEAHMVTKEGFNALLKLVEEPPAHVKFIFATTEPEKVLGTIRSRTHHYPFRLVPPKVLTNYLAELCEAEHVAVEQGVLPLVVRAGAGSVRDSLSVLDQLLGAAGEGGVSYRQATGLLGFTPDTLLDEIMDAFAAGDSAGVFACIDKVMEVGQDPRRFAEDLLRRLRDLIIVSSVPEALTSGLIDVAADQAERLTVQAQGMGSGELTRAAEVLAKGLTDMRGTTAPRLHLELMCSRVLLPGSDVDARGIHARLDRLERRMQMVSDGGERPGASAAAPARGRGDAPRVRGEAPVQVEQPHRVVPPEPEWVSESAPPVREEVAERPRRRPSVEEPPRQRPSDPNQRPDDSWPEARAQGSGQAPGVADPWPSLPTSEPQPARGEQPRHEPPAAVEPQRQPWSAEPQRQHRLAEPSAPSMPAEPQARYSEPPRETAPQQVPTGALSTSDIRGAWPQILDGVKKKRRVTWILLSQNTQVQGYVDGVLTLGIANKGARDSMIRGNHLDMVRDAFVDVLGVAPTVEVVAADDAAPRPAPMPERQPPREVEAPVPTPAREPRYTSQHDDLPEPPPEEDEPFDYAALARESIRPTQIGVAPSEEEVEQDRSDIDLDDTSLNVGELLKRELGARLITEEDL